MLVHFLPRTELLTYVFQLGTEYSNPIKVVFSIMVQFAQPLTYKLHTPCRTCLEQLRLRAASVAIPAPGRRSPRRRSPADHSDR